jgi:hypothetical protein
LNNRKSKNGRREKYKKDKGDSSLYGANIHIIILIGGRREIEGY